MWGRGLVLGLGIKLMWLLREIMLILVRNQNQIK